MSEVEKITMDEARELVSAPALWPRVRDFLWDFVPSIHESWLEDVFSRRDAEDASSSLRASAISASPREPSSPRVKRFVLDSLGVEPCFHAFPKDDWSRLLLLDGATLESMVRWLGALACADRLRGVTDGKAVRALKAALPGVYPEVFGYTAYFGDWGSLASRGDAETQRLEEAVLACGNGILSAAVSGLPAPLVSRLRLKLPKSLCASASTRETSPLPRERGLSSIRKLLKLRFPEAYSLCCS